MDRRRSPTHLQSHRRLFLPLRLRLRRHLGSHLLDLPVRNLPLADPCKGRLHHDSDQLGEQLRPRLRRTPHVLLHQLETVHDLRDVQRPSFHPHVFDREGDQGQDARGDG